MPTNIASVNTSGTGYFTEIYRDALLEWGEAGFRIETGKGIRFFTVRYFGAMTRTRK